MNITSKNIPPYLLMMLTAVGLLCSDMYIPALPLIERYFHVSNSQMQFSVTLFFIGAAIPPLIFGCYSDRYGRKPIVILSTTLLFLGSLVCTIAETYHLFLTGKLLQGIGAGGTSVLCYTIIQDCLKAKESSKIIAYLGVVLIFIPTFSPIVGGYISEAYHWKSIFEILLILSTASLVAAIFLLPETLNTKKTNLHFKSLSKEIYNLLKQPLFLKIVSIYPIASIGYWAFLTKSAFIFSNIYHLNIYTYKYLISVLVLTFAIGCLVSRKFSRHYELMTVVKTGSMIALFGAVITAGMQSANGLYWFILGNGIFLFAIGLVYSPSTALALSIPKDTSNGLVSSIRSMFVMIGSTIGALSAQHIHNKMIFLFCPLLILIAIFVILLCQNSKIDDELTKNLTPSTQ